MRVRAAILCQKFQDRLTFSRVWRDSSTLGELIVASPARRRQWPGHPWLSHLSSSCLLSHATPATCFGIGRTGNSPTTMTNDGVQAWPTVRLVPAGTAFLHGPSCNKKIECAWLRRMEMILSHVKFNLH